MGLTYEDSIDYWEQTVGVLSESALARLQSRDCLQEKLADMCGAEQKLFESASGPLAMHIIENELTTIQDAVCDVDPTYGEAAGEAANTAN